MVDFPNYIDGAWVMGAKLVPNISKDFDQFGSSLDIDNGIIAIGAKGTDDNGVFSGAAYLFNASTGEQIIKILPNDGGQYQLFGNSIDLNGDRLAVAGEWIYPKPTVPSAYLFEAVTGAQIARFLPVKEPRWGYFGKAICIHDNHVLVGTPGDNTGLVYAFDANAEPSCLYLQDTRLVPTDHTEFTISGGTPGAKAILVYGKKAGITSVTGSADYCATFGIDGVDKEQVIDGFNHIFDSNGTIKITQWIPKNARNKYFYLQAAQQGTCPDECVSNLLLELAFQ